MLDEERYLRLQRDAAAAPAVYLKIEITVGVDGSIGMSGPFGDKALFLAILQQCTEQVKATAKDKGWLIIPHYDSDSAANPEGYK
jgi:hypothetical protein